MNRFTRVSLTAILFSLFFTSKLFSITIVSAASGNWINSATWNPQTTPGCGDSIIIQTAHTVSISTQQNYNSCSPLKIIIYGKLKFMNGSKLSLPCGSYIIVKTGGKVEADVGLANSNLIEICNNVEWNSNTVLNGPACLPPTHPICGAALPVELSYFGGSSCDKNICLNWQTESERNCDHFEVQRSIDGIYFYTVKEVSSKTAAGYSYYRLYYEATDESAESGINYYRLKQVDRDGTYSYSKTLSVQKDMKAGTEVVVYPSITSGEFSALIKGINTSGDAVILLRNSSGNIVHKEWRYLDNTNAPIHVVPAGSLTNGVYYCSFLIGSEEYNAKIVVSNVN